MTDGGMKCRNHVSISLYCGECHNDQGLLLMDQINYEKSIKKEKISKNLAAREALRKIEFGSCEYINAAGHLVGYCPSCASEKRDGHDEDCPILKIWEALLY